MLAVIALLVVGIAVYRRKRRQNEKYLIRRPHSSYGTMNNDTDSPMEAAGVGVVPTTHVGTPGGRGDPPPKPKRNKNGKKAGAKQPSARTVPPTPPCRDYDADLVSFLTGANQAGAAGAQAQRPGLAALGDNSPYADGALERHTAGSNGKDAWISAGNAESAVAWKDAGRMVKSSSSSSVDSDTAMDGLDSWPMPAATPSSHSGSRWQMSQVGSFASPVEGEATA